MTNSRCMKKLLYIILSLFFFNDLVAQPILCDSVSILKENFEYYYHSSEYDKAISCGEGLIKAWDNCNLDHDSIYCAIVMAVSNSYYFSGNLQHSIQTMEDIIPTVLNVFGMYHLDYTKSISDLALYYFEMNNYYESIRLKREALDIIKELLGTNNTDYASSLSQLAKYYYSNSNYNEAVDCEQKALTIYKELSGVDDILYLRSLSNLALYFSGKGDYVEAIRYGTEAMIAFRHTLGNEHPKYLLSLSNLADYYAHIDNYTEAIRLGEEVLKIREKVVGTNNSDYAISLNNLSQYYLHIGNYVKAIEYGKKGLAIFKEQLGENHPNYAIGLGNLASYYHASGDYYQAIILNEKALHVFEESVGKDHLYYLTAANNLAILYAAIGDYNKDLEYSLISIEKIKSILGEDHPYYPTALVNLAISYFRVGDFANAIENSTHAIEIIKKDQTDKKKNYADIIYNISSLYGQLGDYHNGIALGHEAFEIYDSIFGNSNELVARALNNLGVLYDDTGDYTTALDYHNKALSIWKELFGESSSDYILSLNNIASCYDDMCNYTKAIEYGTLVVNLAKSFLGESHPDYALYLENLGSYYYDIEYYDKALEFCNNACAIKKRVLGETHPDYISSLQLISKIYYKEGNFKKAYSLLDICTNNRFSNIAKTVCSLTSRQRFIFWSNNIYSFSDLYPSFFLKSNSDKTSDLYNISALYPKDFLLSSEIELSNLIKESDDEEALRLFEENKTIRLQLQKTLELPIAERQIDIDSLENEAEILERKLLVKSKAFGNFTKSRQLTWKEVQSTLSKDEIAIEFLSFNLFNTDSTLIAALTLRKDDEKPHFYPLFELSQLQQIEGNNNYISDELTNLLWKPIINELDGIKRIYFSPAGALHRISIENSPEMAEYEMYRLSSTKEIINLKTESHNNDPSIRSATLYGGIDFDELIDIEGNTNEHSNMDLYRQISISQHHMFVDSLKLRGKNISYLPGTLREVQNIKMYFEDNNITVTTFVGKAATETSVKSISNQNTSILHIATHGFYYTEPRANKENDLHFMIHSSDDNRYLEERMLTRSGLLFAGANKTLKGIDIPLGNDDGILTALEISQLDLRNVNLVVLSACETGTGEIAQGEGVFGLQRGFKKAGVKSILMSLWDVNDITTEMLMTEFYKNICEGKSKRESLRLAQKKVREYRDPDGIFLFQDPQYWAGFILLD